MKFTSCSEEHELTAALRDGRWPAACDLALRQHVKQCGACSDLVLVATTLKQAHDQEIENAPTISSGLLWWRAQLRRRNAALEQVSRPVGVAAKFALALSLMTAFGLVMWQRAPLWDWLAGFQDLARPNVAQIDLIGQGAAAFPAILLVVSLGTLALFGGVVIYLVFRPE